MKFLSGVFLGVAAVIGLTTASSAQDFDCKTAKGAVEEAICSSKTLRDLDEQMGVQFGYARRAKLSEKAEMRVIAGQKKWLKTRNKCGGDKGCLEEAYKARIKVLEDEADTSARQNDPTCLVNAYSIDKDKNGLNVRSGPSKSGKIIKKLKPANDGGYMIYPEFEVIGAEGDWLRITNARQGLDGDVIFQDAGWVHRNLVATTTRGYDSGHVTMRKARSQSSAAIADVPRETEVKIRSCNGDWALVEYHGKTGWLAPDDMCGTAETTCN